MSLKTHIQTLKLIPRGLLLLLVCFGAPLFSQNPILDSVDIIYKLKNDTAKVYKLSRLAGAFTSAGEYDKALEIASETKSVSEKINFLIGQATAYNLNGNVYLFQAKYSQALDNYFNSLKLAERANRPRNIANANMNIGIVYDYTKEQTKAFQYLHKALFIYSITNYTLGIANACNSLGSVFRETNPDSALVYFNRSLSARKLLNDLKGEAGALNNIGLCYMAQKKTDKAIDHFLKSLTIKRQINDVSGICNTLGNMGDILVANKDYKTAEKYYRESYDVAQKLGTISGINKACTGLSTCYENLKKPVEALFYYKLAEAAKDSIFNEGTAKKFVQTEMSYNFEKKELQQKAEQEKKEVIAQEQKRQQNIITIAISIGLIAVLIFSILILRSLRENKRKNKIITEQKLEVEKQKYIVDEKQKEIVDSIRYAKRIQQTLMPSDSYIDKNLKKLKKL